MNPNPRYRLIFPSLLLCLLAACGGGGEETIIVPTPTPAPTLTLTERVTFSPGLPQNPLRLVIRPVNFVDEQMRALVVDILGANPNRVTPDSELRDDLDAADDLSDLNTALDEVFGVEIAAADVESLTTLGDLTAYVQAALADRIEAEIFRRTSLYFEVVVVDRYALALSSLCESGSGLVSIAWLDGLTYTAANARNCGQPALQVGMTTGGYGVFQAFRVEVAPESTPEPETTLVPEGTAEATPDDEAPETPTEEAAAEPDATPTPPTPVVQTAALRTGTAGLIVLNRALGVTSLDAVRGRAFCRLGSADFYSWLLPSLVLEINGIDPARDLGEIEDYATIPALVRAVARGDCVAAGISEDMYSALALEMADEFDDLVIANTTVALPYPILMYPLEVQLGVRLTLNDLFIELGSDRESGADLRWLLGQDMIVPVDNDALIVFNAFMATTGRDFAQLGN